jgi:putative spermidine/putrescine transport system permease protein
MRSSVKLRLDDAARWSGLLLAVLALAFLIVPLVVAVAMSFDSRDYLGRFPPSALSLRWYVRLFTEDYFLIGFKFSLMLAALAALISTAVGVGAAITIDRREPRTRDFLTSLFISPLIVPGVLVGFALLLFYSDIRLGNGFLRLLGAHVLITFPYVLRTALASLAGIRHSMIEAALSLGANERRAFWSITLPLAKTGIAAGAVFAFAFSLDDVAASVFLSDAHYYTLPVALLNMMYANFDLTIAAAAVLLVGVTILLMLCLDRLIGLDRIVGAGMYRH